MRILLLLVTAACAFAADDPWTKVRELKSGTEIRIYKKGSRQPLLAKSDEATADKLMVVVKNEQATIDKEDIDRIDYRPPQPTGRVKRETRETTGDPINDHVTVAHPTAPAGPSSSSSSSVSFGSGKADFELLYRRTTGAAQK